MQHVCTFANETIYPWSRYFSLVKHNESFLMIRKNGQWDGDLLAQYVGKKCEKFGSVFTLMKRYECTENGNSVSMSHNTAFIHVNNVLLGIGGQDNKASDSKHKLCKDTNLTKQHNRGLWSSRYVNKWTDFHLLSLKKLRCFESRRSGYLHTRCEFDGRVSVVRFNDKYFMYVRHNPFRNNGRHVLLSTSPNLVNWTNFTLAKIASIPRKRTNDIYTFYAFNDPKNSSRLLSLYPLLTNGAGSISLSCSEDGIHWSAPLQLIQSKTYGSRSGDHPVHGTWSDEENLYIIIQHDVLGVVSQTLHKNYQLKQYMIRHDYINSFCIRNQPIRYPSHEAYLDQKYDYYKEHDAMIKFTKRPKISPPSYVQKYQRITHKSR